MRRYLPLLAVVFACGPSVPLGPQVTCPGVMVQQNAGECDLVTPSMEACSDQNFYEINCGDDATCTCVVNGQIAGSPVFVTNMTSGFCATLTVSMMHGIAAMCEDPLPGQQGDNLNLVPGP